ncbi:MAG TPA: hypothetical protein VK001_14025 [Geminicoccaceae bacterium]|nr:hypothetical protein [Geminicoccaceae bacterium]
MKAKAKAIPMGPKAVRGSEAARRLAALLLEAWCGVRTTQSASEGMGVAITRFYQLEARALQAVVQAMEPRPRGRQKSAASELAGLRRERQKLSREVERYQTLYRAAQRALGVAESRPQPGKDASGKRRRRPRQRSRAEVVASVLRSATSEVGDANGTSEQGQQARGQPSGRVDGEGTAASDRGDADRRTVGR